MKLDWEGFATNRATPSNCCVESPDTFSNQNLHDVLRLSINVPLFIEKCSLIAFIVIYMNKEISISKISSLHFFGNQAEDDWKTPIQIRSCEINNRMINERQ